MSAASSSRSSEYGGKSSTRMHSVTVASSTEASEYSLPTEHSHISATSSNPNDYYSSPSTVPQHNVPVKVHVNDQELLTRARAIATSMDFHALLDISVNHWQWKTQRNDFTIFSRYLTMPSTSTSTPVPQSYQVLAVGEIACTDAELMHILRVCVEADHNSVMSGLYKKDFIYGTVAHVVPKKSSSSISSSTTLSSGRLSSQDGANHDDHQVAVKTATFVRPHVFAKNEQWCYLDFFQKTCDGFTLTLGSMDESELSVGKAKHGRVDQLHGLSVGFSVERIPNTKRVRVLFHGRFDDCHADIRGSTSVNTTKSRLLRLAKGCSYLPEIVRRRRLGVQTLADRSAFAAKNRYCICCTKSLHLLTKKKRCYLCGYIICDKCWSIQKMETRYGHITPVRICNRCVECIDACEYAYVDPRRLGAPQVVPDPADADTPGYTLARYLRETLETVPESKKELVKTVIKEMMGPQNLSKTPNKEDADVSATSQPHLTEASTENEYMDALDKYLLMEEVIPLAECALANAASRKYPIKLAQDPANVLEIPLQENEQKRLDAIEQGKYMEIGNSEELDIICSLAAREMECMGSMLTIIGQETEYVLASNLAPFKNARIPRNQTFCQHTILDDKPLVVPNPEADIRFHNTASVVRHDIKFYCGFPVKSSDDTIVGSVCCVDTKKHDITQSQYTAMKKLADTASRIMQMKGQKVQSTGSKQ